ncbi:hypothetical protein DT076_05110 [Desertihabitans brevis]|uniref:DUF3137 domain-containing protein n=1 Tax=Desertihabitans brevis TaxID=2268447 RepID=A0A367YY10_9ACTN|nr:hypothetical protein [Desertihabitans brevis]RCK70776.1 hypothetical protein DT076_05110 [Desertihabitans brevis]
MATTFDTRALTRPVTPQEVSAFRRAKLASGDPRWRTSRWVGVLVLVAFAVVFPLVVGANVGFMADSATAGLVAGLVLLGVILAVGIVLLTRGTPGRWERMLRAEEFARANAMEFSPRSGTPPYQGAIFGVGSDRTVVEHVWSTRGPVADVGTYRYTTGSGKNRTTHTWQFAAIRLDGHLPHLLLDAKVNNTFLGSNLPTLFAKEQRLSLGGEFDRHFDLYSPEQYGHDAFYIFTPDLMAHLIDETAAFDVEVVDDWMFLYTRHQLRLTDPATWQRLARISDTVSARMLDRSRSYRDDRAPLPPGVAGASRHVRGPQAIAPQGRRLKRRVAWLPIVLVVGYMVVRFVAETLDLRLADLLPG